MPRMDGLAATRAFRAWERRERPPPARRLPIVALSANVFDEQIAECTAASMDGACCATVTPANSAATAARAAVTPLHELTTQLTCAVTRAGFLPKPLRLDALRGVLAAHNLA
jgi:CheY-like chemotaxis protein